MTDDRADAVEKAQALVIEINKEASHLADSILDYLFLLKVTGHNPPTPPRPKKEVLARVTDSVQLLESTLKVIEGLRGPN